MLHTTIGQIRLLCAGILPSMRPPRTHPHGPRQTPIIVFSHLRWHFVTQRPQHLLTRLSAHYPIIVVEEPITNGFHRTIAHIEKVSDRITVVQPYEHRQPHEITAALTELLAPYKTDPILWFYSAAFIDYANLLPHQVVVYDCMDELSLFHGASPKLVHQEQQLLSWADVVFTGGKSLYESKRRHHHNVHCFPSSVDTTHFLAKKTYAVPEDIASLPSPRIGYYGVIDERLDYDLLSQTAAQNPSFSFVMIGPVVKVDPDALPKSLNLHYLGQRDYEQLPSYLSAFDVAMMPFAHNESTQFISPTKTLEYFALHKPVISTSECR